MRDVLSELTGEKHTVDHIFPIHHEALCGLHVPWNLRVITNRENGQKRNSLPAGFFPHSSQIGG
jgi:5-methylcytosine-specific restriction endonuclease McrA